MIQGFFLSSDKISENKDYTKYILREAFEDALPKEILTRKKQGFPVPLDIWFKGDFIDYAKKTLLKPESKIKVVFDIKKLEKWINLNLKKKDDKQFGQKLWMILNLEIWLKKYF